MNAEPEPLGRKVDADANVDELKAPLDRENPRCHFQPHEQDDSSSLEVSLCYDNYGFCIILLRLGAQCDSQVVFAPHDTACRIDSTYAR